MCARAPETTTPFYMRRCGYGRMRRCAQSNNAQPRRRRPVGLCADAAKFYARVRPKPDNRSRCVGACTRFWCIWLLTLTLGLQALRPAVGPLGRPPPPKQKNKTRGRPKDADAQVYAPAPRAFCSAFLSAPLCFAAATSYRLIIHGCATSHQKLMKKTSPCAANYLCYTAKLFRLPSLSRCRYHGGRSCGERNAAVGCLDCCNFDAAFTKAAFCTLNRLVSATVGQAQRSVGCA
jgi:hypothetical protein